MKQTILFVYPTLFNPKVGGVERVTDILARLFVERGKKVYYLHNKQNSSLLDYAYPASIYFFPDSDYKSQENIEFYHKFLKEHDIDFVINQCGIFEDSVLYTNVGNNKAKVISVLHSNPLLNYEHLTSQELILKEKSAKGLLKLFVRLLLFPKIKQQYLSSRKAHLKYLFAQPNKVVLLSSSHIEELYKYNIEYCEDKICVIPNPCSFPIEYNCNKKKQILYVGRLDRRQKRPDRLLKIWKKLHKKFSDWELIIVGDGKERIRLERQAKKLERITFAGFQSPEQYYSDASIFCMTSNYEGFGMVLTEAMAFGTIPFAFNSYSAVHDIIEDGKTGFLVKPFSIKEYAQKLEQLMNNEDKRIQMSNNCVESVTRFSLDNIITKWESLFNSLSL